MSKKIKHLNILLKLQQNYEDLGKDFSKLNTLRNGRLSEKKKQKFLLSYEKNTTQDPSDKESLEPSIENKELFLKLPKQTYLKNLSKKLGIKKPFSNYSASDLFLKSQTPKNIQKI